MTIVRLRGFEGQIWGFFRTNFGGASGAWPSAHVWRPIFSRHQISIVAVSHCHNGEIHRNFDLKFCSGQGENSSGQIVSIHCYILILDGNTYGSHSLCIFDQGSWCWCHMNHVNYVSTMVRKCEINVRPKLITPSIVTGIKIGLEDLFLPSKGMFLSKG